MKTFSASFRALFLFDIAEEISLDEVRRLLDTAVASPEAQARSSAPGYVRFERPPIVERVGQTSVGSGTFEARLRYFDIGVISVELETNLKTDWDGLVQLSSRWIDAPDLETCATAIAKTRIDRLGTAVQRPYGDWIVEDYHIFHLTNVLGDDGLPMPADAMISSHAQQIAQIIRAELVPLSDAETRGVLASNMSFYRSDVVVAGWMAALVYDTPENAAPVFQLLEYANVLLLEYRRYDDLLARVLMQAYDTLERPRNSPVWSWKLNREAERLNTFRLDVMELTERTDNAVKFLSDMFYARLYRMALEKVGVNDYRPIVDEKLRTAGELYAYMVSQYRDARMFILELTIVLILMVDLAFLFRGK